MFADPLAFNARPHHPAASAPVMAFQRNVSWLKDDQNKLLSALTMPVTTSPSKMAQAIIPEITSIWRFSLSLCGTRDVADDLTQATILRAMERHKQFQEDSSLTAWCITICRSIWLNEMRAQAVRKTQSLDAAVQLEDVIATGKAEDSVFTTQVFAKVMELPAAQREVVMLVYVEGFKYTEAAAMLDVPIGTVMSRLSTARQKLKELNPNSSQSDH